VPAGSEGTECSQRNSQRLSQSRTRNRNGLPDAGRPFCLRTGRPRQLRLWRAYWIRSLWSLTLSLVGDQTNCRSFASLQDDKLGATKKRADLIRQAQGRLFALLRMTTSGRWPSRRLRRGRGRRSRHWPRARAGAGTSALRCCPWRWRCCAVIRCVLFVLLENPGIAG
jgi:hypothetical protein